MPIQNTFLPSSKQWMDKTGTAAHTGLDQYAAGGSPRSTSGQKPQIDRAENVSHPLTLPFCKPL